MILVSELVSISRADLTATDRELICDIVMAYVEGENGLTIHLTSKTVDKLKTAGFIVHTLKPETPNRNGFYSIHWD